MMDSKPILQSLTIRALIAVVVVIVLEILGYELPPEFFTALGLAEYAEILSAVGNEIGALLFVVLAKFGRIRSKATLFFKRPAAQGKLNLVIALVFAGMMTMSLSACAVFDIHKTVAESGGDIGDQAYALLAEYNEADAEALELLSKPGVPRAVIEPMKKARTIARPLVDLIRDAASAYRDAQKRLEASPGDKGLADKLVAAFQTLTARMSSFRPKVDAFIEAVDNI